MWARVFLREARSLLDLTHLGEFVAESLLGVLLSYEQRRARVPHVGPGDDEAVSRRAPRTSSPFRAGEWVGRSQSVTEFG